MISVAKTIGEHVVDLKVELILRSNGQILELIDAAKAMPGVKDIIWTEVVEEERKKRVSQTMSDSLWEMDRTSRFVTY